MDLWCIYGIVQAPVPWMNRTLYPLVTFIQPPDAFEFPLDLGGPALNFRTTFISRGETGLRWTA